MNASSSAGLLGLLVHASTELQSVWSLMHFSVPVEQKRSELLSRLPSTKSLLELDAKLRRSSCAVVGASASLANCSASSRICEHDIVVHVNDHAEALKMCPRVDVQLVNQHACFWKPSSDAANKGGFFTQPQSGALRTCRVVPKLARIRHEWSPQHFDKFSRGALLSSGVVNRIARTRVGKCCASAGGVAASLALEVCKSVTLFGLAGVNQSHFDSRTRVNPMHDLSRERQWMFEEERRGRLRRAC
jgi:hypothetical protein